MHIDTFDDTNTYNNIAISELANEVVCLFYLVGEDDKKSAAFSEYLKTKIANNIMKRVPINEKTKTYQLSIRSTYGTETFNYDPIKGLFKLGYHRLDAPINQLPVIKKDTEPETKTKSAKTKRELARECEFPMLNFNWGFHTQASLMAGHPMTLFSKSVCDIKLANLLKMDAEDRVIAKGINLVNEIQNLIIERLKAIIETYSKITNENELPNSVSNCINNGHYSLYEKKWSFMTKGSKFLNNNISESLLKLTSDDFKTIYYYIMRLFGIQLDQAYNPVYRVKNLEIKRCSSHRCIIWGETDIKMDWLKTIFDESCQKKLQKENNEYQILFINNAKACDKLIDASKTVNTYIDKLDENMCLSMGIDRRNIIALHAGLTADDINLAYNQCITKNDLYVSNGKTITNEIRVKTEKERAKYLFNLYQEAVDNLPENIIEEFNKLMSKTKFTKDMKLTKIHVVKDHDNHNHYNSGFGTEMLPSIAFEFKNVPHKTYKNNKYVTEIDDDIDRDYMYFECNAIKDPNDPVRHLFVNNLIDVYNKLYNIDNDFIRPMLKRVGLIKEGFVPEKY